MKYQVFKKTVKANVERKLEGLGIRVTLNQIVKANDCIRDGLMLIKDEQDAAPTIYLEDFYCMYENGVSIEEIVNRILDIYEQAATEGAREFLKFSDFDKAREHITFKLLNTAVNQKYMEGMAHLDFLDLSLVFYCTIITGIEQQIYSSRISREQLDRWQISLPALYELARINTERMLGVYLKEIKEVFLEMTEGQGDLCRNEYLIQALDSSERFPMYLLSNRPRYAGAGAMMLDGIISSLAEQLGDDLYIIPSSIHEVLLIPYHSSLSRLDVEEMVQDVNRNVLLPAELLSDHPYIYSREEDRIGM